MLYDRILDIMTRFSYGKTAYLKTVTTTGGNPAYGVPGTDAVTYLAVTPKPVVATVQSSTAIAGNSNGDTGQKTSMFTILFTSTVTESLVNAADGIVIGGTYNEDTHIMTGGDYYQFQKSTAKLIYLDNDTPSGVKVSGVLK